MDICDSFIQETLRSFLDFKNLTINWEKKKDESGTCND